MMRNSPWIRGTARTVLKGVEAFLLPGSARTNSEIAGCGVGRAALCPGSAGANGQS